MRRWTVFAVHTSAGMQVAAVLTGHVDPVDKGGPGRAVHHVTAGTPDGAELAAQHQWEHDHYGGEVVETVAIRKRRWLVGKRRLVPTDRRPFVFPRQQHERYDYV